MSRLSRPVLRAGALAVGIGLLACVAPAFAGEPTAEERLAEKAPTIVVIRGVFELRLSMGTESQTIEMKDDALGAVVDPSGLVLVVDPDTVVKRIASVLPGLSLSVHTKSLKLLAPDGSETDVVSIARDGILGLGFLQILEPAAPMPFVDLAHGGAIAAGTHLLGLRRLARGFDHALSVERCYVTHRLEQPRVAWVISGQFAEMGLPVFDRTGRPVGVVGFQESAEGGDIEDLEGSFKPVVLPLEPVRKAIEEAKRRVPEAVAKAKASLEPASEPPKAPDVPKAPESPKLPDVPKGPEAPKAPEAPPIPEAPAPESPAPDSPK